MALHNMSGKGFNSSLYYIQYAGNSEAWQKFGQLMQECLLSIYGQVVWPGS